jgi:hypothetical protein
MHRSSGKKHVSGGCYYTGAPDAQRAVRPIRPSNRDSPVVGIVYFVPDSKQAQEFGIVKQERVTLRRCNARLADTGYHDSW